MNVEQRKRIDQILRKCRKDILLAFEADVQQELFITDKEAESKLAAKKEIQKRLTSELDTIYKSYPRKVGKRVGIERLLKGKYAIQLVDIADFEHAVMVMNGKARVDKELKYIPHFSTFVTKWEDYKDMKIPTLKSEEKVW